MACAPASKRRRSPRKSWLFGNQNISERRSQLRRPLFEMLELRQLLTATWDGGGVDDKWKTAGNWEGDTAPTPGDALVFPANVIKTSNVNDFAPETAFGSVLISGSNYQLTGNSVILAGGVVSQGSNNSFDLGVQLSANAAFGQTVAGTFTVTGSIALNGHNLSVNTTDYSGITLFNGSLAGVGNLTTGGNGQTVLATANSYTGITSITGGALIVRHAQGLGSADNTPATGTVLSNNAYLQLENSITVSDERLTSTTGGIVTSQGNNVWTGDVSFGDANNAYSLQFRPAFESSLQLYVYQRPRRFGAARSRWRR
jgi:autotransporter-associated beta strand protein